LLPQSLRVSIGKRKSTKHEPTDQIVTERSARCGRSNEVAEAAAIAAWKHAAGDGLKDHAVPVKLQERTLTVAVADAIWQKQLHSMRGQLLFRVNSIWAGRSSA
jgi:predicted nucleic acid-binding Zn ribbon protein